jgi:hypothetical protein
MFTCTTKSIPLKTARSHMPTCASCLDRKQHLLCFCNQILFSVRRLQLISAGALPNAACQGIFKATSFTQQPYGGTSDMDTEQQADKPHVQLDIFHTTRKNNWTTAHI